MEEKKEKKEWKTPELIVLVRSKPEEAVLAACKTPSGYTPGPNTTIKKCSDVPDPACRRLVTS